MEDRQWCLPVTYDEGLRSYKAIAFIESLTTISYLKLGATQQNVFFKQKTFRCFSINFGESYG
jgi:hypothetical protein